MTQELHSALKKVQVELAKYSHVNKKALDQYVNFTEQREELNRRQQEVQQSGGQACTAARLPLSVLAL